MKTKTEVILIVLKYLALLGAIGFSIECGSQILSLAASFIKPEWAKNVYRVDMDWLRVRDYSMWPYLCLMSVAIAISALKATAWYVIFNLLQKFQIKSPFTMVVAKKLENVSYLLMYVWVLMDIIGKTSLHYIAESTGLDLHAFGNGGEYFFIAGMVYIISQIFKRGIEMQEENQLTV